MLNMSYIIVLILILSVSYVFSDIPNVVILSFDGIHPRYIDPNYTPKLYTLINGCDTAAGPISMMSVFPSKTMTTHFTISTGTEPRVHQLYNNEMFSPDGQVWSNDERQFKRNQIIVPIWIENEMTGGGRHSGVMMWPGGEFEYQSTNPTHVQKYQEGIEWNDRVDTIVKWMTDKEKKANLVMAYFENKPCYVKDQADRRIREHMTKIDDTIEKLYKDLKAELPGGFDMIVISDKGSQMVTMAKAIDADSLLPNFSKEEYKIIISGPLVIIKPTQDKYDEMKMSLDQPNLNNFFVMNQRLPFTKNDIIVLLAVDGYTFLENSQIEKEKNNDQFVIFENGYNDLNEDMDAFFTGIGKNFKKIKETTITMALVDVYIILKRLLNMTNNVSDVQQLLYEDTAKEILADKFYQETNES